MDVICPRHAPIHGVRPGDLFLLDLDSEAFAIGNELLILYGPPAEDESWLGDHRVISKTVFAAESLTDMLSRMVFGEPREIGLNKLHAFLDMNSQQRDVRCCFVCARHIEREKKTWPWPSKLRRTPNLGQEAWTAATPTPAHSMKT